VFVTAQGSVYAQFKRALKGRNLMLAWTMAAELPKVPLADVLELLLLARDLEPARFDRGVPRWHARLCTERRLSSGEAQLALAALNALPGPGVGVRRSLSRGAVRGLRSRAGDSGAGGLARRSRHLIAPYALRGKAHSKKSSQKASDALYHAAQQAENASQEAAYCTAEAAENSHIQLLSNSRGSGTQDIGPDSRGSLRGLDVRAEPTFSRNLGIGPRAVASASKQQCSTPVRIASG
jgi:hypothetical protein